VSVYPGWAAISSVKQGLSANEGLRQFRAAGGKIGRSAWLALRAEVGAALANRPTEMAAPLNAIPGAEHVQQFTTTSATGVIQQVEVLYRVKGTDTIVNRPFSVKGQQMITRQDAIQAALDQMALSQQRTLYEEQVILGAVYVGTYQLVPGGAQ
jgi:hypothetical protein